MPGNSHGWRSLVGCSPWGRTESDTTEGTAAAAVVVAYSTYIVFTMRIFRLCNPSLGFPGGSEAKISLPMQETQKMLVQSPDQKIPWRRKWQLTSVFLPGEVYGQRRLAGYNL